MASKDETTDARLKALEDQNLELAARNEKLMNALEAKFAEQAAPSGGGISREDFLVGINAAMKGATQASELLAKKMKPENVDHLELGPFEHKEGGIKFPKSAVAPKREIIWGKPLKLEELTYPEVLALRELDRSLARSQRRVAHDGAWKAIVSDDDQRILISLPVKTIDDRAELPSFLQIVQELTTGERALDAADLAVEIQMLKAQVSSLQAAH